ncbi:epididymal-specific lipocalin-8-like [Acomys russatus]|uniref:epididymal-specific lipocalin-8-like n=1 Tax=Acomys russatus TaxID=60746 RepID=UPI0021E22734|nr:epididymal-specific lipocalin-8-like [Acomys russatus]
MEARLPSITCGLFLALLLQAESTAVELVPEKITGFWKEVAVASDQNLMLKAQKRVEGLFLTVSGRSLTVKAVYNSSGSCVTETSVGSQRDSVGEFTFPGHREICVLDTDYEHYAILKLSLLWQGRTFQVLKYFTRSLENEDEPAFWRFREMTAEQGLYMPARHGERSPWGRMLDQTPGMGAAALLTVPTLSHPAGRCAELLKEVSPCYPCLHRSLALMKPCWCS